MGILNAITLASFGTGALIFTMFGLTDVGGVAAFAACYGFVSGSGMLHHHHHLVIPSDSPPPSPYFKVLSLFSPVMVIYAQDPSEIGSVHTCRCFPYKISALSPFVRVRIGFGAFITGIAWLVGPPIAGAVLTSANNWDHAITFSGVRLCTMFFLLHALSYIYHIQVIVLCSVPFMLVARHGQAKRKKTQFV